MKTEYTVVQAKMCERCGSTKAEGYEVVTVAGHEFCDGCVLEAMAMQQFRDIKSGAEKPIQINVGFMGSC